MEITRFSKDDKGEILRKADGSAEKFVAKYPVRISYLALKNFKQETGKDFEEIQEEGDMESLEPLLFYSLQAGALADGLEFTIQRSEVEMILDEVFLEFSKLFIKFFPKTELSSTEKKTPGNRNQRRKLEKGKQSK